MASIVQMLAYVKSRSITSVMLNSKDEWRAITLETSDLAFINDPLHSPMISTAPFSKIHNLVAPKSLWICSPLEMLRVGGGEGGSVFCALLVLRGHIFNTKYTLD